MLVNEYERIYWDKNQYIMGIDEAGRGPLCGPLVVACCILPINYENEDINDSKQLSEKKRNELFKKIINDAMYYDFIIVSPKQIDKYDIYHATQNAMQELSLRNYGHSFTITDAMKIDNEKAIGIIKGDAKSISIASASILAKVLRDHIMYGYDVLYPEYGYRNHKGYGTKLHLENMDKYGLNELYRMSYAPCKNRQIKLF